jgi:hypothetical protein
MLNVFLLKFRALVCLFRSQRSLVLENFVEEGGFSYDSECYNDDLPYWTLVKGTHHLVVPYSLAVNDCRYVLPQGYGKLRTFF